MSTSTGGRPSKGAHPQRRLVLAVALVMGLTAATACQPGSSLYGACGPAADGNRTGTDGAWVLVCRNGEWVPFMTVQEYVGIVRGEPVTIGPVPTKPPPATTTVPPTTTSTTTSTSTSTTTTTTSTTTTTIPPGPAPTALIAGDRHTCALYDSGSVSCWGTNQRGQLGSPTNSGVLTANPAPLAVTGIATASAITAGTSHTCALLADSTVSCWGLNASGQLGNATNIDTTPNPTPATVVSVTTATAIAAGDSHTCALLVGGGVQCWGLNDAGQLGNATNSGTSTANTTPLPVTGITTATAIAAAGAHTCALLAGGTVTCWGRNQFGELGNTTNSGTLTANPTPLAVTGITTATRIAAAGGASCALIDGDDLSCWGSNVMGELGTAVNSGVTTPNPAPATVSGVTPIVGMDGGTAHVCAVFGNSTLSCWGANAYGQAGNANSSPNPTPVLVAGITSASAVVAGGSHSCVLLAAGSAMCWGLNNYGQLGNAANSGMVVANPTPLAVQGL